MSARKREYDAVVVGAGISGLYAVYTLRRRGLSVIGLESAAGVGGTWHHNRYPGARCDVESIDYSYSFDEALEQEWTWSERFATQTELLAYLEHVAERHDLARSFEFLTRVVSAEFDENSQRWTVYTDTGQTVTARYCVMATGVLSATNRPDIPGRDDFAGESYHTGEWPHEPVDFTGKRVGVIGTGSSGIQSIPVIAETAEQVLVFQRSPNYSIPAGNRPLTDEQVAEVKSNYRERRRKAWASGGGTPFDPYPKGAMEVDEEERRRVFDEWWTRGGYLFAKAFPDQTVNLEANDAAREYVEARIRGMVVNPEIADDLIPTDHPIGTKRIVTDAGYYTAFNRDNVTLVNLRKTPIQQITETGVSTTGGDHALDILVYATGFDAMTGALSRIDIRGRDNLSLRESWAAGPRTYLGLMADGFPNLFIMVGPGSPSVLANMVLGAEQQMNWIDRCLENLEQRGATVIEPTSDAVDEWGVECNAKAAATLFPTANSWYMGANIEGKPRVFMPYLGGFAGYGQILNEVAADDYRGFRIGSEEDALVAVAGQQERQG